MTSVVQFKLLRQPATAENDFISERAEMHAYMLLLGVIAFTMEASMSRFALTSVPRKAGAPSFHDESRTGKARS